MTAVTEVDGLQEVFNECTAEGNVLRPPLRQLDPDLYATFKKHMTANLGKWKGGNKQYFQFEYDAEILLSKLQRGERPSFKKDWHYFPTPPEVIDKMGNIHIPSQGEKILEPSAGRGAIVEGINNFISVDLEWSLIEANPINLQHLKAKGFEDNIIHHDFDTYEPNEGNLFDLVLANPPFKHDLAHVSKMAQCVVEGGSVVTVVPSNFCDKYQSFIERMKEHFEWVSNYPLDDKSFKASGTMVSTSILHLAYLQEPFLVTGNRDG